MHYDKKKKPGLERRRKCWTLAAEEPVPALAEPLCVGDQAHFALGLPPPSLRAGRTGMSTEPGLCDFASPHFLVIVTRGVARPVD